MAFNLQRDQRHQFQAKAGVETVIAIAAPATTLASVYYKGQNVPVAADGTATFSPVVGTYFLTVLAMPAVPPESWKVIEKDGTNQQMLENEDDDIHSANLVIVGNS